MNKITRGTHETHGTSQTPHHPLKQASSSRPRSRLFSFMETLIMQYINHWPDATEPALPKTVSQELYRQLLEPFDSEASAKEFWNETSTTIIILDPRNSIEGSKACRQIEFILVRENITLVFNNCSQTYPVINKYSSHNHFNSVFSTTIRPDNTQKTH